MNIVLLITIAIMVNGHIKPVMSETFNKPKVHWKTTYTNATCFWNEVPINCRVEYNTLEATWRVHWGGKIGGARYYERRGGNWFRETYENGSEAGAWELHPKKQLLVNTKGETIKFLDLR